MVHASQMFDPEALSTARTDGLVTERRHPVDDLWIYNYTPKAQYSQAWNEVTLSCRGLILDADSNVVARPLPKIFNHTEYIGLDPQTPLVSAYDKIDGSLGIMYWSLGEPAIATRGSFASEQAEHATEVLQSRYGSFEPFPGLTYLFEIVYPDNRIVLDYGDTDDLVLLGAIDIEAGGYWSPDLILNWPGPKAESYGFATLGEALKNLERPEKEGFVVKTSTGLMLKVKQPDYLEKHKLVFGLSKRRIWERMGEGATMGEIVSPLPDEWQDWAQDAAEELLAEYDAVRGTALLTYDAAVLKLNREFPGGFTRKDFAAEAKQHGHWTPYLFALYDGRDISGTAWKEVRP